MTRRRRFAALYSLAMVALLEGGARWLLSWQRFAVPSERSADPVWRGAWVERLRRAPVYNRFDVYDPTRGWALASNLRDADALGPASLNSNSIGLRGRAEFAPTATGGLRLLALGDSTTFGAGVRDEETWPSRLRERLPGCEVMNFGVHGYGYDQMLLYFVEQGMRYQPDLVLVGFVRDAMARDLLEFRDYAKPRMVLTDNGLEARNLPVPTAAQSLRRQRLGPRLVDLWIVLHQAVLWRSGANIDRMEAVTAAILDRLVEKVSETGGVTVFAYLPHGEELDFPEQTFPEERFFAGYCHSRAAFCVNLRPLFLERMAAGDKVETPDHWLASGHALAAESVARYLRERQLLGRSQP